MQGSDRLWHCSVRCLSGAHHHSWSHRALGRVGRAGDRAGEHLDRLQWQCGRLCWPGGEGKLVQLEELH